MPWLERKSVFSLKKTNEHKCKFPFNWFGVRFKVGSVWFCDECKRVYLDDLVEYSFSYVRKWSFVGYKKDKD